jgi:hypothetical protein
MPRSSLLHWQLDLTFLVLNLGFYILDGVRGLHLEGDSFAREGLYKDLHPSRNRPLSRIFTDRGFRDFVTNFIYFSFIFHVYSKGGERNREGLGKEKEKGKGMGAIMADFNLDDYGVKLQDLSIFLSFYL